jgi:hypothetical protein
VKALVTGGAGFIGSHLCAELTARGAEVSVLDDLSTGRRKNIAGLPVRFIESQHHRLPARQCGGGRHRHHRASGGGGVGTRVHIEAPMRTHDVNVTGTLNVLQYARDVDAHVVVASSAAVYGNVSGIIRADANLPHPLSPYAASNWRRRPTRPAGSNRTGCLRSPYAPDGSWVLSTGADGTVRIWEPRPHAEPTEVTGHKNTVRSVAIAPDGSWFAGAGNDGVIHLWDKYTGGQLSTLPGHDGAVLAVAVAADGAWLASVGIDRTVRVWEVATQSCVAMTRVEKDVTVCAWSPTDNSLFVGGDAGLYHFQLIEAIR